VITLINGKRYHYTCFDCSMCDINIYRSSFYLNNETGYPICLNCFEITKLPKCAKCSHHISPDQYLIVDNMPLHFECHRCVNCNTKLSPYEDGSYSRDQNGDYVCYNCSANNQVTFRLYKLDF
jgi:hypothetical protein